VNSICALVRARQKDLPTPQARFRRAAHREPIATLSLERFNSNAVVDGTTYSSGKCKWGGDLMVMVEAAGVEPASEKVCREKATCVSDSVVFVRLMRNRQERGGLARLISAFSSGPKLWTYPAK
jgi:hypothetical protein